jgi:hypothetical protein
MEESQASLNHSHRLATYAYFQYGQDIAGHLEMLTKVMDQCVNGEYSSQQTVTLILRCGTAAGPST